jgi:two-component system sensor histidine kinase HydH
VLARPLLCPAVVKANAEPLLADNARLREALARSVALMQRANELASLGRLTAAFAHEVRNPLVALRIFAQLLPTRWDDAEFRRDFSHVVMTELERVEAMVREFLAVAHEPAREGDGAASGGAADATPISLTSAGPGPTSRVSLAEIVDSVLPLVRVQAREKDVEIVFERADEAYVDAESLRLRQVVMNLVLNAIDATPAGGSIVVRCDRREGTSPSVALTVRDSGRGIAADDLPRIFEPFFTTREQGTGLGLAITRQIVEGCGGSIRAESAAGAGATFVVELPASAADLGHSAEPRASHG